MLLNDILISLANFDCLAEITINSILMQVLETIYFSSFYVPITEPLSIVGYQMEKYNYTY